MATTSSEIAALDSNLRNSAGSPSSSTSCHNETLLHLYRQQLDNEDGLRDINRNAVLWELWCNNEEHSMTILELVKAFELDKKKNAASRRYKFRQIIAEITYIRNYSQGFTLVLKKKHYPVGDEEE